MPTSHLSLTEMANTIITVLCQQGHQKDLMNSGHFAHIIYALNVIYYLKYQKTILTKSDLNTFKTGLYGPYNQNIIDSYEHLGDPYDFEPDDISVHYLENQIQDQYLIETNNVFSVKTIPFDINTINPQIRQFITNYAESLWKINAFDLSEYYTHIYPSAQPSKPNTFHHICDFNKAVEYFKEHPFWKTTRRSHYDQSTSFITPQRR